MSEHKDRINGAFILEMLDTSRNPLKLAGVRNDAITYIKESSDKLPESKAQACRDYVANFDSYKRLSDQLRDLSVWVDEVNAYLDQSDESKGVE